MKRIKRIIRILLLLHIFPVLLLIISLQLSMFIYIPFIICFGIGYFIDLVIIGIIGFFYLLLWLLDIK